MADLGFEAGAVVVLVRDQQLDRVALEGSPSVPASSVVRTSRSSALGSDQGPGDRETVQGW